MIFPKWEYAKKCFYKRAYGGRVTWFENLCLKYYTTRANQLKILRDKNKSCKACHYSLDIAISGVPKLTCNCPYRFTRDTLPDKHDCKFFIYEPGTDAN
jgi:hypothetical protein